MLGADYLINYRKDQNWGDSARRLTAGRGVDHVIEVGHPAHIGAQSMVADRGHIAIIGILSGGVTGNAAVAPGSHAPSCSLKGLVVCSRRHQMKRIRAY